MAVWGRWTTSISMQKVIDYAVQRTTKATNKWSMCYGPGAAFVLTCARLNWTITSATKLVTDMGELLDMVLDPPKGDRHAVLRRRPTVAVEKGGGYAAAVGSTWIWSGTADGAHLATTQNQDQGARLERHSQGMPQVRPGE